MTEALNQIGVFIMQNNKINEIVNKLKDCLDCLEALKKYESRQKELELVIKYLENTICFLGYVIVDGELLHESDVKYDHSGNPRRIND